MNDASHEELWAHYQRDQDPAVRAEILTRLTGLVHHVARQTARRVGDAVPLDDLLSAGSLGLVQAFGSFDPSRGVTFVTYATTRIRGAILDELRAADWRPRSVRSRGREIAAAAADLERKLGRSPRHAEVAHAVGVDLDTYWQWLGDTESGAFLSLDTPVAGHDGVRLTLADRLADPEEPAPGAILEQDEQLRLVTEAISALPGQQRTVLSLCYHEGLSIREVAEVLHVSESRISQIRSAAIRSLRLRLAEAA